MTPLAAMVAAANSSSLALDSRKRPLPKEPSLSRVRYCGICGFKFEILAKPYSIMLLNLSDRAKFRVTGRDRVRFLNGQLTNDIRSLRPGSAICACALTAKGKLCAYLFVAATDAIHYLDADSALRESLAARLEKYIIADDVVLKYVTEEFGLFHLTDAASPLPLEGIELFQTESIRFAMPGVDSVSGPAKRLDPGAIESGTNRCGSIGKSPH